MRVLATDLERFVSRVLQARGAPEATAALVAERTVRADCAGVVSHGVARLGAYLGRIDAGVMAVDAEPVVAEERAASALLDARNGWGQVAATRGMELAVAKATSAGIGVVSVARSNHFGVAGHYAQQAAETGCIGIAMTNASPAMAPFNAKEALLGTNPLAVGVPVAGMRPIVLDMSSSLVARGKIRRAHREGATSIPQGWANDRDGRPTTDPAAALEGLLAPIGGAKGTGLSLVIDVLSGLLSGTGPTGSVANINDASRPAGTGHLLIAIDPAAFIGRGAFEMAVAETVARIQAMEAADGGRVLVPGQLELERAEATTEVELAAAVASELAEIADRFGITRLG